MAKLSICTACGGFAAKLVCPHCGAAVRSAWGRFRLDALGGVLGGGAIAFTLMACYGMPPCEDGSLGCYDPPDAGERTDGGADGGHSGDGDGTTDAKGEGDAAADASAAADAGRDAR